MFTKAFALAAGERAVKTFAQAFVALLVGGAAGIVGTDWLSALNVAGMAAVVSLLTSVASGGVGEAGPSVGPETLSDKVAAAEEPPAGYVAGPAAPVEPGTPVDVLPTPAPGPGSVQDVVDEALNRPTEP